MRRTPLMIAAVAAAFFSLTGMAAPATAGAASAPPGTSAPGTNIITQLKHLPGVTYLGTNPYPPAGYQVFELEIRQPVDHHHPGGATFEQHLELYQRDVTAPMVMFVSGYFNYTSLDPHATYLSDPATITGGNQISVEHRFYGESIPQPATWKDVTIWQEAADEHHVVRVFKQLYRAPWLITGLSKGGETAVFHDYYYPHDFAGTFAWSAPSITSTFSHRYDRFLAHVGTAACRSALVQAQTLALQNRAALEAKISTAATAAGETFNEWNGGLDEAFEVTVLQTPFVFWQYGGDCSTVPDTSATVQQLYDWFDATAGWLALDDQENVPFLPYNYEAGTQLGYPIIDERAQLGSLLHFPLSAQAPQQDLAPGQPARPLDQGPMRAVHQWVRNHGSHLLFLYGQLDPWSAQPFTLGPGTSDSASYTVAGGNHLSGYTLLPTAQEQAFVGMLRTWAGLPAAGGPVERTQSARAAMTGLAGGRQ
jgi:hypothetical protein